MRWGASHQTNGESLPDEILLFDRKNQPVRCDALRARNGFVIAGMAQENAGRAIHERMNALRELGRMKFYDSPISERMFFIKLSVI